MSQPAQSNEKPRAQRAQNENCNDPKNLPRGQKGTDIYSLEERWNMRFNELNKFKEEKGHCNVPQGYSANRQLAIWVNDQRALFKKGKLRVNRIEYLDSIGFCWGRHKDSCDQQFKELQEFKEKNGHCNVPYRYSANRQLGIWVHNQRTLYKKGKLSDDRTRRLEDIGFLWEAPADCDKPNKKSRDAYNWDQRFNQLGQFKEENGHCNVPRQYSANCQLGIWVSNQRSLYHREMLLADRRRRLEDVGFPWRVQDLGKTPASQNQTGKKTAQSNEKPRAQRAQNETCNDPKNLPRGQKGTDIYYLSSPEERWNMRFNELNKFKEEKGHCNVPYQYSANPQLGIWVKEQRALCKKGKLREDRIEYLDSIGFCWDYLKDKWDQHFKELKQFKEENGHCNIPCRYSANPQLGDWVKTQREFCKKGKLREDRIDDLDSIGFCWGLKSWDQQFKELEKFKEENGHFNVPRGYSANPQLGDWTNFQRAMRKKGKLSDDRIECLDSIGFSWVRRQSWDQQFKELEEFKQRSGHCNVPQKFSANPQLGDWVHNQRAMRKKGKLSDEHIRRLENIGFLWGAQGLGKIPAFATNIEPAIGSDDAPTGGEGGFADTEAHRPNNNGDGITQKVSAQEAKWNMRFEEVKRFKEEKGHCNVPQGYSANRPLAIWVNEQRALFKKGKLRVNRIEYLDSIGFCWTRHKDSCDQQFKELQEFKEKNGHCNVPYRYSANRQLGIWVHNQRTLYKKGKLSDDRTRRLEDIGFLWGGHGLGKASADCEKPNKKSRDAYNWDQRFNQLGQFKEENGHCNVPRGYSANRQLGIWVSNQRSLYHREMLLGDRRRRLEDVGFPWRVQDLGKTPASQNQTGKRTVSVHHSETDCDGDVHLTKRGKTMEEVLTVETV